MLIKVKNPVCNQSTHLSDKPLQAQESHKNSPKPCVESNFRGSSQLVDQNNETVKKQILLFFYSLQELLDITLYPHYY